MPGGVPELGFPPGHFFAAAAEAMRRILIDDVRRKRTEKHGGQPPPAWTSTTWDPGLNDVRSAEPCWHLDEALGKLEARRGRSRPEPR